MIQEVVVEFNTSHIIKHKAYLSALIKVSFILNIVDAFRGGNLTAYQLLKTRCPSYRRMFIHHDLLFKAKMSLIESISSPGVSSNVLVLGAFSGSQ